MNRRDFLKHGLAVSTLAGMSRNFLFAGANSSRDSVGIPLTINLSDDHAMICQGERVLVDYLADDATCSSLTSGLQKSPCFIAIAGPATGRSLISAIPQPWRQASGVSFACDRVLRDKDKTELHFGYGPGDSGRISSMGLQPGNCTATSVEFHDQCYWYKPGWLPFIGDKRRFRLSLISEAAYILDCEYILTPRMNLTVQPSGQSLFSLCAADDLAVSRREQPGGGGRLLNSHGQQHMHPTSGSRPNWYTFFGQRAVAQNQADNKLGPVEGIAVLSSPNAVTGCRWLTRDYGLLVPNSLHYLDSAFQLHEGETYRFAYRIVAYSGLPDPAMLNRLCDELS
ncbi:MAG: PmoA family protein [Planctomycetaceae bacterium]|nr:PmoA family protein [Planctomycetaceae bacterium]